jgi:hypothetical protein
VLEHTDDGLPKRQPGARLIPGAANSTEGGLDRNGGAHRSSEDDDAVASAAELDTGGQQSSGAESPLHRDPDAVRASIGSHFGGVHAGRSHARETRGTDSQ